MEKNDEEKLVREEWMFSPSSDYLFKKREKKIDTTNHYVPTFDEDVEEYKVGDGGASWKKKTLLRSIERGKEKGLSVNEILKERGLELKDLQQNIEKKEKVEVKKDLQEEESVIGPVFKRNMNMIQPNKEDDLKWKKDVNLKQNRRNEKLEKEKLEHDKELKKLLLEAVEENKSFEKKINSEILYNKSYKKPTTDDQFDSLKNEEEENNSKKRKNKSESTQQTIKRKHNNNIAEICPYCFESSKIRKHLIISIGEKMYLSLPPYGSFVFGNLVIAPLHHKVSFKELDKDEIIELNKFKLSLKKMFAKNDYDVVFMETGKYFTLK
jgi:hypothetical protein